MKHKAYILVVDDESMNQMILEEVLGDDYEIAYANNGFECLDSVKNRCPDVLLLDVNMPKMGGLEACQQLRAIDRYADLPIIMLSALALESEQQKGLSAGANAYLSKPFNEAELIGLINQFIAA